MKVKYLKNVNEAMLPDSMKNEFYKIKNKFILSDFNPTILAEFEIIEILQRKDSLYQYNDDKDFDGDDFDKPIFVKLTDDDFFLFKVEFYKGYIEGYENNDYLNFEFKDDSDNKDKIHKVFSEVHEKFDKLKFNLLEIPGLGFYCQKPQFNELGVEVGTFIKCWDIILNHSFLFEKIFDKHYNQQPSDNGGKDIEEKEKMKVIALLHYYNGQYITRDNAQSIANNYGYNAKTSGEGLYQDFLYYVEKKHRIVSGESTIKHGNKIKLFERVVELLINEEAKSKAITELNLLKAKSTS